jgi:hypothetical protein
MMSKARDSLSRWQDKRQGCRSKRWQLKSARGSTVYEALTMVTAQGKELDPGKLEHSQIRYLRSRSVFDPILANRDIELRQLRRASFKLFLSCSSSPAPT